MLNNKTFILSAGSLVVVSTLAGGAVYAQSANSGRGMMARPPAIGGMIRRGGQTQDGPNMGAGIVGTVTAVNGNIITVHGRVGLAPSAANVNAPTPVIYTIDASKAKITKMLPPAAGTAPTNDNIPPVRPMIFSAGTTIAVSDISVGDTLMVRGTVNGTNIAATTIVDGQFGLTRPVTTATTGKTMILGAVTAINGSILTVTSAPTMGVTASVTYTVDATNATVKKYTLPTPVANPTNTNAPVHPTRQMMPTVSTVTIAAIAVGDNVRVQGALSGANIVATEIVDGARVGAITLPTPTSATLNANMAARAAALKQEVETVQPGLWAKIMTFFSDLFGKKTK